MQLYNMRVCNRLLIKLKMNGINSTDACIFFGLQVEEMLKCPVNYGPNSKSHNKAFGLSRDIWLLRGFYPNTPQMFKISVGKYRPRFSDHSKDFQFEVKVSEPTIKKQKPGSSSLFLPRYESTVVSNSIKEHVGQRLEKHLLESKPEELKSLVNDKEIFTPKCISPKGMPFFSFKKD